MRRLTLRFAPQVIENARAAIAEEDSELRSERVRLRELMSVSATSRTEGERASAELRQAEQRLRATEAELARRVKEHERLRNELMERSTLGESLPAQLHEIDAEVRAVAKEVEASRRERNAIREERAAMQARVQDAQIVSCRCVAGSKVQVLTSDLHWPAELRARQG